MISVIRRFSATGPRAKVVLFRALQALPSNTRDLMCVLPVSVIGSVYSIATGEIPFSVGVEWYLPYLQESKRYGIHSQYIYADIRKIEFKKKSFDTVIALNVLEHLTKQEGFALLNKMEKWANKKVLATIHQGNSCSNLLKKDKFVMREKF